MKKKPITVKNTKSPELHWDDETDILVVGFGGAGSSAAIEAAEQGVRVLVVERFNGGGATKASGGIVYSGGGTSQQKMAGFEDTPENMFNYLKAEARDAVTDETLKVFCRQSRGDLEWLERLGVRFDSTFYPSKTSYPHADYYLYYSGNEPFSPYNAYSKPAPRGHRPVGKGLPGNVLFQKLKKAAVARGVRLMVRSKAVDLISDSNGEIAGLEISSIPTYSPLHWIHACMGWIYYKMRYAAIAIPLINHVFGSIFFLLELGGRKKRIRARKGVILAAGGFIFNRKMVRRIAPQYLSGAPLGAPGDDGSGIALGTKAGGFTAYMNRIAAWRFITPPEVSVKGILVDDKGVRICNEQLYGAQMGEAMVEKHRGKAWLIIDSDIRKKIREETGWGKAQWFQTLTTLGNLYFNRKKSGSLKKLERRCGIPRLTLESTVESYNSMAGSGSPDPMGKADEHMQPLDSPPFYAINCSLGNRFFPCATITLGGLVVDEGSGELKRDDGSLIHGLYAVGRNAAGIPSGGYVSGLSIAHCVFSGRLAGRHAARRKDRV